MKRCRTHVLKTLPRYWDALEDGTKTFEVRKDDRSYAEGDLLILRRFDPADTYGSGTPRWCGSMVEVNEDGEHFHVFPSNVCHLRHDDIFAMVSYVMPGGKFGIDPDYVVLGIHRMRSSP